MKPGALVLIFAMTALPTAAQVAVTPPAFRAIDQELIERTRGDRSPAIAVAVAHRGRIVWEAAYGYSDAQRSQPASVHTPFAVASIAKTITATALMRLVERGDIDLDRTVASYLPGAVRVLHGDPGKLTVRALATMTGGIPHLSRHRWTTGSQVSASDLRHERTAAFAAFPPGESFLYSNWSFGVLGRVMEAATRQPFARIMESEVFGPLGMSNSWFADGTTDRPMAVRLNGSLEPVAGYSHTESVAGASLVASAHDLALFGALHAGRAVGVRSPLQRATIARMHTVSRPGGLYGLGIWNLNGAIVADGAVLGGAGIVKVIPEEELVAVVVTNAAVNDAPTYRYIDRLLEDVLKSEGKTLPAGPTPPPDSRRPFVADALVRGRFQGGITLADATQPISLLMDGDSIVVESGTGRAMRASEPRFEEQRIRFAFNLEAGVATGPYTATLSIHGDTISGFVATSASRDGLGLPRPVLLVRQRD